MIAPVKGDLPSRYSMIPPANIPAGLCISCGRMCFVNPSGAAAIRDRDADVCCIECESRYTADINASLIES